MDNLSSKVTEVTFYSMTTFGNLFCSYVIVRYHLNKPLGMETLLSKVIVLLVITFAQAGICATVTRLLSELAAPLDETLALMGSVWNFVSALSFMLSIFITLVIKYLSVYHSYLISHLDEERILPYLWITVLGLPGILAGIQFYFLSAIQLDTTYQLLRHGKLITKSEEVVIFYVILLLNLTALLGVVVRIEVDYSEDGYLSKITNWLRPSKELNSAGPGRRSRNDINIQEKNGYSIVVIRLMCLILVVLSLIFLLGISPGTCRFLLLRLLFSVICPAIFIWNHNGIKSTLKHQVQSLKQIFSTT